MSASWQVALDVQMGIWRWYQTDTGAVTLRSHYATEAENLHPDTQGMQARLYSGEIDEPITVQAKRVGGELVEVEV